MGVRGNGNWIDGNGREWECWKPFPHISSVGWCLINGDQCRRACYITLLLYINVYQAAENHNLHTVGQRLGAYQKIKKKTVVPPTKRKLKARKQMRSMTAAASFQSFFISSSTSAFSRSSAALRSLVSKSVQILISRSSVLLKLAPGRCSSGAAKWLFSLSRRRHAPSRFSAWSTLDDIATDFDCVTFMRK